MTAILRLAARATIGVALAYAVVVAAGCSRGPDVGRDDAVELLVGSGLDRDEAECLVAAVGDELDLAEVTGLQGDLDEAELVVLYEASQRCRPAAGGTGGVVGGPEDLLGEVEELGETPPPSGVDVETVVAELLVSGLAPDEAVCVATHLLAEADSSAALADPGRRADAVAACATG